ncbi:MAG: hypothetical protein GEU73_04770 [Chloroflexi bacterium]|nr:hypothetical protein [Chloroflexota bacterium]
MNPNILTTGMRCTLSDGSLVEVRSVLPDHVHVRVRYLDTLDNPEIRNGEEREVPFEELIAEYMGTHAEGLT